MSNKIIYKIGLSLIVGILAMLVLSLSAKYYLTTFIINFAPFVLVTLIVFLFTSGFFKRATLAKKKNIIGVIFAFILTGIIYNEFLFSTNYISILASILTMFCFYQIALFCYEKIKGEELSL